METPPRTNLNSTLRNQLVRYGLGAAAVAAAAAPGGSEASVITTNAGSITGDNIFFDLNGGGVSNTAGTAGATDFRLYLSTGIVGTKPTITAYSGSMNAVLAVNTIFENLTPRLQAGDTVGAPGQSFFGAANFDQNAGEWSAGTRGFLGLALSSGGNTFYGWADIDFNNFGGTNNAFTLHGFAFEDVAGQAITINGPAQAGVPENGPTALLLMLGAAGVVALRARRQREEQAAA